VDAVAALSLVSGRMMWVLVQAPFGDVQTVGDFGVGESFANEG
jgi:hypothetical protein